MKRGLSPDRQVRQVWRFAPVKVGQALFATARTSRQKSRQD
jgi:hypothetical protein